jgi:hypothetical protein
METAIKTPALVGKFECRKAECQHEDGYRTYEVVPPFYLDLPECPTCGASLELVDVYERIS